MLPMSDTARLPPPAEEPLPRLLERLWDAGQRPDVYRLLAEAGPRTAAEVTHVLSIDQWRRWQAGERVPAEDYLRAFPALQDEPDCALELIYGELLVREQLGEPPDEEEYLRRFPLLADRLRQQFEMHRALLSEGDPAFITASGNSPPATLGGPQGARAILTRSLPRLPGYEILKEVARGGMGVVYKARDTRLNRIVALKMVLGGRFAQSEDLVRFLVEAEMAARVRHPNIVQIHEVGTHDGLPFFVLEYVEGGTLAQQLDGTPWPTHQAAALVESLARAIHAAHLQGIIHRDLKPANILLQRGEEPRARGEEQTLPPSPLAPGPSPFVPKITDFGLAKHLETSSDLTRTGVIVGTPGYMSPEQAAARRSEIGPATDIWALGSILYELLAGRLPFRGAAVEILQQVLTMDVPALSAVRPPVPRDLQTVCLKCLRREPAQRYPSAEALAEELRRFRAGEPVTARPVGTAERAWRWARRNPAWAATLLLVAGLLLVVAVGASLMTVRLDHALEVSEGQRARAEAAERVSKHRLWEAYLAQARASRHSGRQGQYAEGLQALREALKLPVPPGRSRAELRDEAAACLVLPDLVPVRDWPGWTIDTMELEFDGAVERYAHLDRSRTVTVRRLADHTEITRLTARGPVVFGGLSLSPDGRFLQLRVGADGLLTVWQLDGSRPALVLKDVPTTRYGSTVAFSRDSRRLAAAQQDGSVCVYSLPSGRLVRRLWPGLFAERLAFHPSGHRLAVAGRGTVRVLELDGRQLAELTHPATVYGIAWHPDGKILAAAAHDYKIRLWDVDQGVLAVPPLLGHRHMGIVVAFSPDGERLVSSDWGSVLHLWDAGTGRHLMAVPNATLVYGPSESPLVKQVIGSSVRLLRFDAGRGLRLFAPRDAATGQQYYSALASPDGRYLVAATADRLAYLDWASGTEVTSFPLRSSFALAFEPEPSGALLTSGPEGVLRWPVHRDRAGRTVALGPPENLYKLGKYDYSVSGAAGRVLAVAHTNGALVLHRPSRRLELGPAEDVRQCAVSPDGRYVATNNHFNVRGASALVWDAHTGKVVHRLSLTGNTGVRFSPDGRWLVTSGGGIRLWKVGSWEEGPRLPSPPWAGAAACFTTDGTLLALTGEVSQVRLLDPSTGREVARLTVPEQTLLVPQCFSPDGTSLVVLGEQNRVLYSWDLRALRVQLRKLGLDWDWPEFRPAAKLPDRPPRVRVDMGMFFPPGDAQQALAQYSMAVALQPWHPEAHFRRGSTLFRLGHYREAIQALNVAIALAPGRPLAYRLRGRAHVQLGAFGKAVADFGAAVRLEPAHLTNYVWRADAYLRQWKPKAAMDDYRKLLELEPEHSGGNGGLARLLALMPPPLRDPEKALPLARKAMELEPSVAHRHTLGVALYRLKRFDEARACFTENLKADHPEMGFDLFGLAACQHQLGEVEPARETFKRAQSWRRTQSKLALEQRVILGAYEAEVRTTLGLSAAPLPDS
jgi:WD40 repeat protein/tetratricopeptide (TPR) repeat protein/tRNA A-37 threonylcarbamoyl transferase component Bud32